MRQDRLEQALLAADAAGDEDSVRAIALELRQLRATEQYAPTEPQGPSSLQAGLIGAGRVVDKTISGVQDLAYRATGDDEALARLRAEQAGNDRAYAQLQESNPVATAVGEIGAYIPSAMVPGGLKTQMAVAGGMGATQYQENPWQRITSGVEDALLAGVGEKFFDGVNMLRNVWKGGGPQVPRLQSRADELGYKLTPGERLQSETLQKVEAGLESMPIVGAPVRRAKIERQGVVERAAAEAVGEPTLRNDGIQVAVERIGGEFDRLLSSRTFEVDDAFLDSLGAMEEVAQRDVLGGGNTSTIIDSILERLSSGSIGGDELQTMRTSLQTAAAKAARDDTSTQAYVNSLNAALKAIDDLVERTLSEADAEAWRTARGQWRALVQLERSNAINEAGEVSGRKLGGYLSRTDNSGYSRGNNQSDLYDSARLSRSYAPMADSGTATRTSIPRAVANAVVRPATAALAVPFRGATELYMNPTLATRAAATAARPQDMVNELYRTFVTGEPERDLTYQEEMARLMRGR